jgi:hypothetical protein
MADWNEPGRTQTGFGTSPSPRGDLAGRATYDEGLRSYMLAIYNYMASGVLLTGIVALLFASSDALLGLVYQLVQTPRGVAMQPTILGWIVMLAPLAIVFGMSFGANRLSKTSLLAMFWGFTVLFGMSLSNIFIIYTGGSIAATFFATAGAFAGLSLWSYTTKRDISGWGSFLVMGVVGLIIAMLLNVFIFQSVTFDLAVSAIGVLIFAGLTAWRTQMLRNSYFELRGTAWEGKMIVLGALGLYISFINMFLFLLRFMGAARD